MGLLQRLQFYLSSLKTTSKLGLFAIAIIAITLPVTVIISGQQQEIRQRAAETRSLTITYPNGGETLDAEKTYSITWTQNLIDKVYIYFRDSSNTLWPIVDNLQTQSANGVYNWTIPSSFSGKTGKIDILGYQTGVGSATDLSDNTFNIAEPRSLNVTFPTSANQTLTIGQNYTITWTQNRIDHMDIYLVTSDQRTLYIISNEPTSGTNGSYDWRVPETLQTPNMSQTVSLAGLTNLKIKLMGYEMGVNSDTYSTSTNSFNIVATSSPTATPTPDTSITPDLIIESITYSPSSLIGGSNATFNIRVKNQGSVNAAGFWVNYYIDGTFISQQSTGTTGLAAGASKDMTPVTWNSTAGTHTFKALADPPFTGGANGWISESNENNNDKTVSLTVTPPTATSTPTPTVTPVATNTPTPTATLTPTPTTPVATATSIPGSAVLGFNLNLMGLGEGGNTSPISSRKLNVQITGISSALNETKQLDLIYNSSTKTFKGTLDLGSSFPNGSYDLKIKTNKYLTKRIPNIVNITNTTVNVPSVTLIVGDANNDNSIDIEDYNLYNQCFNKPITTTVGALSCSNVDFNEDGKTDSTGSTGNMKDFALLIASFSVRKGD